MHGDGLADLSLLAVQVAEDHVHLERVGVEARRPAQLLDREIDLVGDEEVQAEDVVRRLARAAAVDPLAVPQLVALPGLADRQAGEQRDERGQQRRVGRSCLMPLGQVAGHEPVPAALRAEHQLR